MADRQSATQKNALLSQYEAVKHKLQVHKGSAGAAPLSPRLRVPDLNLSQFDYLMREDKALVNAFRDFLTAEYAQENLDFYRAIIKFRLNPSVAAARRIVDTFIVPSSARQVNVEGDTRETCMAAVAQAEATGSIAANVFDEAQDWIGGLIKNGAWPRFLVSREYEQYRQHVEALQGPPPSRDEPPARQLMWLLTHPKDPKAVQFATYMKGLQSSELVAFWDKCNEMLSIQSPARRKRAAEKIYDQYVKAGARFEVNVDGRHRAAIEAELGAGNDVGPAFEAAMTAVFTLLINGPFLSFLNAQNPFDKSPVSAASEMFLSSSHAAITSRSRSAPNSPLVQRREGTVFESPLAERLAMQAPPRVSTSEHEALLRELAMLRDKVVQQEQTIEALARRLHDAPPTSAGEQGHATTSPLRGSGSKPQSPSKSPFGWRKPSLGSGSLQSSRSLPGGGERRGSLSSALDSLTRIRKRSLSRREGSAPQSPDASPSRTYAERPPQLSIHGPFGADDGSAHPGSGVGCLDQIDELIYNAIHSPRIVHSDNEHSTAFSISKTL